MTIALLITGIFIIAAFSLTVFEDVFNAGNIAGILGGLYTLLLGIMFNKINSTVWYILFTAAVLGIAVTVTLMSIIYIKGKTKADKERVIIVLGCRVKGDKPSLSLIKRVDAAYDFLIKSPKAIAILSGGQGKDEALSEAECMKTLLLEKGIDKNRLILEDKSTTTDENIAFSLNIINTLGLDKKVAVSTSEYHQLRASMICKRYGLKAQPQSSKTKLTVLHVFLIREIFAIIKEIITNNANKKHQSN